VFLAAFQAKKMHLLAFSVVYVITFRGDKRILMFVALVIVLMLNSLYSRHGFLVNVFEEEHGKQGAGV